ncbi:MAG: N-acetyltransferase [Acidobacteria bacterium]|nr:MAG: N-acetyltransferase [Acidobacteriota bacterium]
MTTVIHPITLEGRGVRLEPLSLSHHAQLCEAGLSFELWHWTTNNVRTPEDMRAYIEKALAEQAQGTSLPFATIDQASGKVIGSTRYLNIDISNLRVEIGATWLAKNWQRTAANTEAKYLMLRHAFEKFGCIRVEFKTDSLNQRSREAILRLGAKEEGTLRNHMLTWTGRIRHTVYFSIIDSEWPEVKARLEGMLAHTPRTQ